MVFYGSNDPTNSVKALKEDRVLTIRHQSHQVLQPCYNMTYMQYEENTKCKHITLHTVKWAECDKTESREL